MRPQHAERPTLPTALVVNRDTKTRTAYVEYLKANAFFAEESDDGRVALAKAITERPDVIVMEARLDGIDGFQLCRLLRHDPDTYSTVIVVLTGDSDIMGADRARAAGADAVLTAPCPSEILLAETRRLIELRGERAAARPHRHVAKANLGPPSLDQAPWLEVQTNPATSRPDAPPQLLCPECLSELVYQRSHVGGVRHAGREQWDEFRCARKCGVFRYRHRTRKLAKVVV